MTLNPELKRSYWWKGEGTPFAGPVAVNTPERIKNQPLYGAGLSLEPLYVRPNNDSLHNRETGKICFIDFTDFYCTVALRNNPANNTDPAIVAWPTTSSHVISLVKFAKKHNICVCVASGGHDFLNRHSCDGLLIRTGLMKEMKFDEISNSLTIGPGLTFSEFT